MALTESQHKAINKYRSKNKAQVQYINRRSVAKNFILKSATQEDLDMLLGCIKQRQEKLNDWGQMAKYVSCLFIYAAKTA